MKFTDFFKLMFDPIGYQKAKIASGEAKPLSKRTRIIVTILATAFMIAMIVIIFLTRFPK